MASIKRIFRLYPWKKY